ncbi:unnamed protein product [Camellia sinensis]
MKDMSFEDIEAGRPLNSRRDPFNGNQDPTQAVALAIFQINTAVSTFQRLVNTLGTPKDTPQLREKLRLEVHAKTLYKARAEDEKRIQELERELKNCYQEIGIEILLGKTVKFDELMAATAAERELREGEEQIVSRLGYGCMGLTSMYNSLIPEEDGIAIIKYLFNIRITFFDASDIYGADNANEILVGKIQFATKFEIVKLDPTQIVVNGSVEYVRSCCEASLKRLGVDYIDLYYVHRIDTSVPIEETMGKLKKLAEEGKINYIGLSKASPNTIRRAHAVHPITALQMEYSLLTRDIEEEIIPICRELGIVIVPYSPTAHRFFGGKAIVEAVPTNSFLNLEHNKIFYLRIKELAKKHSCTPVQLALAWILHQRDDMVPIPGTAKIKNLDENIGAVRVKLTKDDLKEISDAVPISEVAGPRMFESFCHTTYQFANTPLPKNSK